MAGERPVLHARLTGKAPLGADSAVALSVEGPSRPGRPDFGRCSGWSGRKGPDLQCERGGPAGHPLCGRDRSAESGIDLFLQ